MIINVLRFDSLDSTNTEAAGQARLGAAEGVCIVARRQTAGRGRHGRSWVSEENSGLYFSIVLRPPFDMARFPLITLMAGIAVFDTLKDLGLRPDIKWVNDVLVGERKVSGILAETVETPAGLAVILGIGVNVRSTGFPDEVAKRAIAIEDVLPKNAPRIGVAAVETKLVGFLGYWYELLCTPDGAAEVLDGWRRRSSWYSGKAVRATLPDAVITGTTDGLEPNGALRLKLLDGTVTVIQAGDVEMLRDADLPL